MTIGERIKDLRRARGWKQTDLAELLCISPSAIGMYEQNRRAPDHKTLLSLADCFGVSTDYLLGNVPIERSGLPSELRTIRVKRFPMLGEIACGEPIFANEDHETYIDASADIPADFCLTAKGDSMIGARIHDGDVVFIRAQDMVKNGDIAAVIINDEATLKRWYYYPEQGKLLLTPENSAYEPLVFLGEELNSIRCLGKAVCFMSNL